MRAARSNTEVNDTRQRSIPPVQPCAVDTAPRGRLCEARSVNSIARPSGDDWDGQACNPTWWNMLSFSPLDVANAADKEGLCRHRADSEPRHQRSLHGQLRHFLLVVLNYPGARCQYQRVCVDRYSFNVKTLVNFGPNWVYYSTNAQIY